MFSFDVCYCIYFFVNDTPATEIYTYCHTLSLPDALPIFSFGGDKRAEPVIAGRGIEAIDARQFSEPPSIAVTHKDRDKVDGLGEQRTRNGDEIGRAHV